MAPFQYSAEIIKEMWTDAHSKPYYSKNNSWLKIDQVTLNVQTKHPNTMRDTVAITTDTVCIYMKNALYGIPLKRIYD